MIDQHDGAAVTSVRPLRGMPTADAGVFAVATTPVMAASPSMLVMASAMVALRPTRRRTAAVPRRLITCSSALIPELRVGDAPVGVCLQKHGAWSGVRRFRPWPRAQRDSSPLLDGKVQVWDEQCY